MCFLVVAALAGTGAYAALGGVIRSPSTGDIDLQSGLMGWWKMDGNFKDATPYRNNGVTSGLVSAADRKAVPNQAYDLSASGNATLGIVLPVANNYINYSYSIWMYPTAGSTSINDGLLHSTVQLLNFI